MAIAVRSNSFALSSGTTAVVTKPAGVVSGDVLVAFATEDSSGPAVDITAPAGWTATGTNDGLGIPTKIFWRVAGGSEGASYTFGTTNSAAADGIVRIVAFTGVDNTTPIQVAASYITSTNNGGNSVTLVAPSVTATGAGALVCYFASQNGGTLTTPTSPVGIAEIFNSTPGGYVINAADWVAVAAGATGTVTSTHSLSSGWTVASLVLNEASAATAAALPPSNRARRMRPLLVR